MTSYPLFSLLAAWPLPRQKRFIDGLSHTWFTDSEIIFEHGDASPHAYFILSGAVKSVNYGPDGKISYFRARHAGDCFGYYGAISGEARTATMVAVGATQLARINSEDFFSLLLENPEIGRVFLKLIVGLLRTETKRLVKLTTLSTHQRIAAELLDQSTQQGTSTLILPSRDELASYLGMTRETLSRALAALRRKKLVKILNDKIVVEDCEILEEFLTGK